MSSDRFSLTIEDSVEGCFRLLAEQNVYLLKRLKHDLKTTREYMRQVADYEPDIRINVLKELKIGVGQKREQITKVKQAIRNIQIGLDEQTTAKCLKLAKSVSGIAYRLLRQIREAIDNCELEIECLQCPILPG